MTTMTISKADETALAHAAQDAYELALDLKKAEAKRAKLIRRAASKGATMREIAAAAGISHQRVAQILATAEREARP